MAGPSRKRSPSKGGGRDESGAVIILALVFLITVGVIVGAVLGLVGNDLTNTTNFNTARSLVYAADSATESAIWNARYTYTTPTPNPVACSTTSPTVSIDGEYIEDWCSTASGTGSLSATRVVTFSACQLPSGNGLSSVCASPFLQAVVTFNDFNTSNVDNCPAMTTPTSCGTAMTVDSWVVE